MLYCKSLKGLNAEICRESKKFKKLFGVAIESYLKLTYIISVYHQ